MPPNVLRGRPGSTGVTPTYAPMLCLAADPAALASLLLMHHVMLSGRPGSTGVTPTYAPCYA